MSDAQPMSRRKLIATASMTAAVVPLAVACGTSDDQARPAENQPSPSGGGPTKQGGEDHGSLAEVNDIQVGSSVSAKSPDGKPILISRPSAGQVVAFSAVCTHMGCTVNPAGKEFHCPCHGSKFEAATGKVVDGPAKKPLPAYPVTVKGDHVVPKGA